MFLLDPSAICIDVPYHCTLFSPSLCIDERNHLDYLILELLNLPILAVCLATDTLAVVWMVYPKVLHRGRNVLPTQSGNFS
ncbi:unnamed protein product [Somion occarium]|uniref:Uncharacterized protein n=1 Tax=Somion occarium TaxID=3059160 RepID=A0ABP1DX93_9APHY